MSTTAAAFKENATEWLEKLGYPAVSLNTPLASRISLWWSYMTCEADFFTRVERDENGKENEVMLRSCTPADMVCTDMASLLYNEKATVSLVDPDNEQEATTWLENWLRITSWNDKAPLAMKRMCSTGTAAWALHIRNATKVGQSDALSVMPIRYDARSIVPLVWDELGCSHCAFVSPIYIKGELCHQIEVHRPDDMTGNYQVFCGFFDSSGKQFEPEGFLQAYEALDTKQQKPTFQIIRLAIDNPYWDYSPMGVALFDNAIGALETVDLAFDAVGNDIFLGKKMLVLPESMLKKNDFGTYEAPYMSGRQFFLATESSVYDGKAAIYEYNPDLRASDDRLMLSTALQMLGKRVGFGTKAYALDQSGNITTAKQVASDNAEMMRTIRKHEHIIQPAISNLIEAAAGIYRTLGTTALPDLTGQVQVVMGDAIMQDEDTLRERDRADVAAGLLEPWRYMVRWQGYTEEDAKAATQVDTGLTTPLEV